ncbi:MAG: hypothetical protein VXW43_19940 [Pseudomonadota bacterium]|nr:hypothetical protein [Pseudomonadota bacterium]
MLDALGTRRSQVPAAWQARSIDELERAVAQALDPTNAGTVAVGGVMGLVKK